VQEDWFAGFVNLIESAIKLCDSALMSATGQKSFGLSIVLFTLLIKVLTYPLTYTQLQSTTKMQAIQPKVCFHVWPRSHWSRRGKGLRGGSLFYIWGSGVSLL
jgi:hypothetical protein